MAKNEVFGEIVKFKKIAEAIVLFQLPLHFIPSNNSPISTSKARAIFIIVLIFISCLPFMYLRRFSTSKSES